ncbi:hypothetical protein A9K75_09490 [Campylobacter fetus subsp. testudinum]|uniref:hypothetical protein n=1 Tax=Campylobacter fetus TaxID=196 RepID=UPI000818C41B|nr:hypothetical protein [Campylobacter fetus]OCR98883.1 hypothetical protein A9K75_09490 [Campylobacter fetus subsp. testudinum]
MMSQIDILSFGMNAMAFLLVAGGVAGWLGFFLIAVFDENKREQIMPVACMSTCCIFSAIFIYIFGVEGLVMSLLILLVSSVHCRSQI